MKLPRSSAVVVDSVPVCWFLAVIWAPGTTAPVWSVTVPNSLAETSTWARAGQQNSSRPTKPTA